MAAKKNLTEKDYLNFFNKYYEFKTDRLSGGLYCKEKTQGETSFRQWQNKDTKRLQGKASHLLEGSSSTLVKQHLEGTLPVELKPELIVDIPKWDNEDHIKSLTDCLVVSNFTQQEVESIFKHWLSGIYKKLENPLYQNPCLVLQGGQGIGKDTWLRALLGGLSFYFQNRSIDKSTKPKDFIETLETCLVCNISEFDQIFQMNNSNLKDIITSESKSYRGAYDLQASEHIIRSSIIGSTNKKNFLVDDTGNRRYIILELVSIQRSYPLSSKQVQQGVLAQAKENDYQLSGDLQEKIKKDQEAKTPKSDYDLLLGELDEFLENAQENLDDWILAYNVTSEIKSLCKIYNLKYGNIKTEIAAHYQEKGCYKKGRANKGYYKPISSLSMKLVKDLSSKQKVVSLKQTKEVYQTKVYEADEATLKAQKNLEEKRNQGAKSN